MWNRGSKSNDSSFSKLSKATLINDGSKNNAEQRSQSIPETIYYNYQKHHQQKDNSANTEKDKKDDNVFGTKRMTELDKLISDETNSSNSNNDDISNDNDEYTSNSEDDNGSECDADDCQDDDFEDIEDDYEDDIEDHDQQYYGLPFNNSPNVMMRMNQMNMVNMFNSFNMYQNINQPQNKRMLMNPMNPMQPNVDNTPTDKWRTKPCLFYQEYGFCRKGDNCNYSHDIPITKKQFVAIDKLYRTKPCKYFFLTGKCRKGDNCNYSHDIAVCFLLLIFLL